MLQTLTLDNKQYVILEKSEYDALRNQHNDDEVFPAEFVDKLLDSDNKIGVWREYRKMTMSQLAESAEISQSYLSDIENKKKDGSIKVLKRIAEVLDADLDMIV